MSELPKAFRITTRSGRDPKVACSWHASDGGYHTIVVQTLDDLLSFAGDKGIKLMAPINPRSEFIKHRYPIVEIQD